MEAGDDTKKMREGSSTTGFSGNDDVFQEGLSNDCYSSLANRFKNIQEKIEELFILVIKTKETQIKSEKQLKDFSDSVKFMSSKIDEHEKERLERETRTVKLESKVVSLSIKIEKLEYRADRMEQYSRRDFIVIHDLPWVKGEDTESLVTEALKKMGLVIPFANIDRTHRISTSPKQWDKVRPVIVKFGWYDEQRKIYINKKLLKGTKISIYN